MTPKQITETILNMDDYLRDVELTYKVPELAQAYLDLASEHEQLKSRIRDLELQLALAEAEADRE